jgi:uncharacterized Ntn-hydrolase superfamily protein
MTFSIVAYDPATGAFGVAVASHVLACGAGVTAVSPKGAVASQARPTTGSPRQALALLERGLAASEVGERLVADDPARSELQLGIVDSTGSSWTYSGSHCFRWAGGRTGSGFAVQGNTLAGPEVVDAMARRFERGAAPFRELLIASLEAGASAGGDARGPQSAALLVAWDTALGEERADLRVDDHPDPVNELTRLERLYARYGDTPKARDLVRMDAGTARAVQGSLRRLGMAPRHSRFPRMSPGRSPAPPLQGVGEPRDPGEAWTPSWQRALNDWMEAENLESRIAVIGWIDARVLDRLASANSSE